MHHNVALARYSTFRMGSTAAYFASVSSLPEIEECLSFADANNLPVIVLGGGSNTIFASVEPLNAFVIKIDSKGKKIISTNENSTLVEIGAGENWDDVVAWSVENNLSGIEMLSAIPGTSGATPIQNVGAYGGEIKNVLVSLRAYDRHSRSVVTLSNTDCGFGYRDSIFKKDARDRYIILSITLRLSPHAPEAPEYPGVKKYFDEKGIVSPTLLQIREAIVAIRAHKLPDPRDIASVGSFFKNPFIETQKALTLKTKYPTLAVFPVSETQAKIGAGSLLDTLGLRGKVFGNLSLYAGNALVIVNNGQTRPEELLELKEYIISEVEKKFGITLEPEPVFVT